MSAALLRHRVAAQNLANADTAGYKAQRVLFESQLRDALDGQGLVGVRTHPQHLSIGRGDTTSAVALQPSVVSEASLTGRPDGNSVDIEAESAGIAGNEIWFASMARLAADELRRLRVAINEGGR